MALRMRRVEIERRMAELDSGAVDSVPCEGLKRDRTGFERGRRLGEDAG